MTVTERRKKRFLSAEQKYDLWVRMLTGQLTTVQAPPRPVWTARRSPR